MRLSTQLVLKKDPSTASGIRTVLQSIWEELVAAINRKLEIQGEYTVATVPDPTKFRRGTIIYVTDAAAGENMQYTDGTTWHPLS